MKTRPLCFTQLNRVVMKNYIFLFLLGCMLSLAGACAFAGTDGSIKLSPKFCKHGLNQPKGGDFAAFVFCDDALGTQIGIILTRPGVGPVEANVEWSNTNRFWQEGLWMTDVKEMVWSKSRNYLYVITSEIYSEEALYELDLRQRKALKLLDGTTVEGYLSIERIYDQTLVVNGKEFKMKD